MGRKGEPRHKIAQPTALTAHETAMLHLIGEGKSNREIGEALNRSQFTIDDQVRGLLDKLGLPTRAAAAFWFGRLLGAQHDLWHYPENGDLPPLKVEVLIAFDTRAQLATGQLSIVHGLRQWIWPAENDPREGEEPLSVAAWTYLPEHPHRLMRERKRG